RHDEALDAYDRALELTPDNPILNSLAWSLYNIEEEKPLAQAETYAQRAVEKSPDVGAYQHTLAAILGAQDKWSEAMSHVPLFLQDTQMVSTSLNEVIAFFVDAAAAGYVAEALKHIQASPSAEILEPMAVALQLYEGEQVDVALEILEVAKDVVKRIEARKEEKRK
ncbi:MAG: hypothetical protein ACE5G0_19120, partial [Rhodothermales bacterium]